MASAGLARLHRVAGWLALAYSLLVAGFTFWNGPGPEEPDTFLFGLLVIPWIAAPVIAASAGAGASSTRIGAAFFLTLEMGFILFAVWTTVDMVRSTSSTAAIGILFLPIPQWGAFLFAFLLALLFGWRMRPDFLEGKPPL